MPCGRGSASAARIPLAPSRLPGLAPTSLAPSCHRRGPRLRPLHRAPLELLRRRTTTWTGQGGCVSTRRSYGDVFVQHSSGLGMRAAANRAAWQRIERWLRSQHGPYGCSAASPSHCASRMIYCGRAAAAAAAACTSAMAGGDKEGQLGDLFEYMVRLRNYERSGVCVASSAVSATPQIHFPVSPPSAQRSSLVD